VNDAGLEVRRGVDADLDEVFTVRRTVGWIDDLVEGELWVARDRTGTLVGSLQIREVRPGIDWLDAVVVDRARRGMGIGAAMVGVVLAGRPNACWLECERDRRDFYRRLGFELVLRTDQPAWARELAGERIDRPQYFMRRHAPAD